MLLKPANETCVKPSCGYPERMAALEGGCFEVEPQFARPPPGIAELHARRPAGDFRMLVTVLGAGRIAEIIGDGTGPSRSPAPMARARQSIPAPGGLQHSTWLGITRCRIDKSSPHFAMSAMLRVTVSQYHGVFARVIAQRPGPNLKSGSQTSVRRRKIFMLSSVMKSYCSTASAH